MKKSLDLIINNLNKASEVFELLMNRKFGPYALGNIILLFGYSIFSIVILFLTWGKMQMGDNSTELAYGQMIRSGLIPYHDFYLHVTPLISYLASYLQGFSSPIHIINVLGFLNLLFGGLVVYLLARKLKLKFSHQFLVLVLLLGIFGNTLQGFNHHSFDVTLASFSILAIVYLVGAKNNQAFIFWSAVVATTSTLTFFITQTYGLAMIFFAPIVLVAAFLVSRKKDILVKLSKLIALQVIAFGFTLALLAGFGHISISEMYNKTFATGYQQYSGTYGHFRLWKHTYSNMENVANRFIGSNSNIVATNNDANGLLAVTTAGFVDKQEQTLVNKIFLNKSALLYSMLTLVVMFYIIVMVGAAMVIVFEVLFRKKEIKYDTLIWLAALGMFLVSSVLVFLLNFSQIVVIVILWLAVSAKFKSKARVFLVVVNSLLFFLASLVAISNLVINWQEYSSREYFLSGTAQEKVWISPVYYPNFVEQLKSVSQVVNQHQLASFSAYPRASEIYYLLGKVPSKGTQLATFYHEGGMYQPTLNSATSSELIVIFEPKYFGPLGDEHEFAMSKIAPALSKNRKLLFTSEYFKVYKKIN